MNILFNFSDTYHCCTHNTVVYFENISSVTSEHIVRTTFVHYFNLSDSDKKLLVARGQHARTRMYTRNAFETKYRWPRNDEKIPIIYFVNTETPSRTVLYVEFAFRVVTAECLNKTVFLWS